MHTLIDPALLAQLKDLPLVAKTVAQGFLYGMHTSLQRGSGMEFSQYRAYEPGDPLHKIDWKLFARSDRYFVRESQRESNIQVWFIIDASASMLHGSAAANKDSWHKLDYAKHLVATMSYLAQHQGDSVGLLGLSGQNAQLIPAHAGYQHWQKCVLHLAHLQSGTVFPEFEQVQQQIAKVREHGVVIVLSDFYQNNNEIFDAMSKLVNPKTDVIGMQLISKDELQFPFTGRIHFEDRETKERLTLSGKAAKNEYLQNLALFNASLKTKLQGMGIEHHQVNIDQAMDASLRKFLTLRAKPL
jgi:uncharacterized protein (DUF58 family)